jgi:asparagine synthase (glutamine-hydrolysing)
MCGIVGIVSPDAKRHTAALARMTAALRHRGPDGSGAHFFPNCALGHTRLTIVDLLTGDQPMLSRDQQVAITFNGEIYGYREIKAKFKDHQFLTTSDTEVILLLYQRYGADMLRHLPGMFSFAIWDEQQQSFFAARDRFGEKPFYYAWGPNGELLFASEIKSLLASGLLKPKLDHAALTHYLRHLYVHPHQTIYRNISVLPPANSLLLRNGQLRVERYWELPPTKEPISENEAVHEFSRLLERAVDRQLVADVPVGTFLSGGLDSSSVVAAASRTHSRLRTFSFGFPDGINELPYAREIADLYNTEHTELEDRDIDLVPLLKEMARVYDEPFADSSNIPMYLISRAARPHVKVVLTGDGGDELLAGYENWYRPLWKIEQTISSTARSLRMLRFGNKVLSQFRLQAPEGLARAVLSASLKRHRQTITRAHLAQNLYFGDDELARLGITANGKSNGNEAPGLTGGVDCALRMDLTDYMPGDILVKTDRASMAHGLELRAPFLDVDFASFCISLPSRLKLTDKEDKWILRHCYSQAWTESVRNRRKCGFGAPVGRWLERKEVADLKDKILNNSHHSLFSLVSFKASRPFVESNSYQTWSLLTLGIWLEELGEESL